MFLKSLFYMSPLINVSFLYMGRVMKFFDVYMGMVMKFRTFEWGGYEKTGCSLPKFCNSLDVLNNVHSLKDSEKITTPRA